MLSFLQHELLHFTIGLAIGLIAYLFFKNKKLIFVAVFVSLVIDVDHLVDYFNYFGPRIVNPYSPGRFWNFFCNSQKLFIPLHDWEFIPLLGIIGWRFAKLRGVFFTLALALVGHYLLDQFSHAMYPLAYSLLFRLSQNFDINAVSWGCTL